MGIFSSSVHRSAFVLCHLAFLRRVGDSLLRIGNVDVYDKSSAKALHILEQAPRPVILTLERFTKHFTIQEVSDDPRKMPFYFEYIFSLDDPIVDQANVMFMLESQQFRVNFYHMTEDDTISDAKRIHDKFFNEASHFNITHQIDSQVIAMVVMLA